MPYTKESWLAQARSSEMQLFNELVEVYKSTNPASGDPHADAEGVFNTYKNAPLAIREAWVYYKVESNMTDTDAFAAAQTLVNGS